MKEDRIALRYAKALFELAKEKQILDEVNHDMVLIAKVCIENEELVNVLKSPIIKQVKKKKIIKEIFEPHFHKLSGMFLDVIINHKREFLINLIAEKFIGFYKGFKNIKTAFLQTAVAMDEATKLRIITILETQTNSQIDLVEKVNPKLIGGFVLNIDDNQIDTSIFKAIKKLTKEFESNIYQKGF